MGRVSLNVFAQIPKIHFTISSILLIFNLCAVCVDRKYNLGVIVDLHAAPGSQNPWEHSSSRDGTQNWGTTDANIAQTVQVIEFLASRSACRSISKLNIQQIDLQEQINLGLHFT
jgi:hypothetical protein